MLVHRASWNFFLVGFFLDSQLFDLLAVSRTLVYGFFVCWEPAKHGSVFLHFQVLGFWISKKMILWQFIYFLKITFLIGWFRVLEKLTCIILSFPFLKNLKYENSTEVSFTSSSDKKICEIQLYLSRHNYTTKNVSSFRFLVITEFLKVTFWCSSPDTLC